LLDDAAVRESYGSDQVKESVGEPSAGAPAATIRGKKLHTPDLSAMPTLDNFIRGSAASVSTRRRADPNATRPAKKTP
jgi:hypothetical protein